jgi:hypothetical protein
MKSLSLELPSFLCSILFSAMVIFNIIICFGDGKVLVVSRAAFMEEDIGVDPRREEQTTELSIFSM